VNADDTASAFDVLELAAAGERIGGVAIAVAAVPEPETFALMLGGLGLLAWIARRRRSAA
jgi:hypothetical protein